MIFHLVNDEKVINRTIDLFETAFPNENLFIVFTKKVFKHVKRGDYNNIISYKEYESRKDEFAPTSVIIHLMTNRKIRFINTYCKSVIPIYWAMWGSDLYDRLLMPKGFPIIDKEGSYYKSIKISRFFKSLIKYPNDKMRIIRRTNFIRKRVKYLVTSTIENDYDIFTSYYPDMKKLEWKDFSYYPIDIVIGKEMQDMWATGNNIQIGNCGTHTNNHEYVLRILSGIKIQNREIIVPLSYSGKKEYKEAVMRKGHELFGDNFKPITNFMSLNDYTALMGSCSIAIYGNWRQEAVGNVMVSLYLGAKVFLSKNNPILEWAIKHGFVVYELEKMTQENIDFPLDQVSRKKNRNILLQNYDSKALYEIMKSTFKDR